jgi:divalent metal cation (Fe/Co/Zn/Cd) transporter
MVFVIVYFGYYIVSHDLKNGENIPKVEVYGLINWGVFISLLVAAFIVFGMFSMVKHKSRTKKSAERSHVILDNVLAEFSGVFFNFGSLIGAITLFTNDWWYFAVTATLYLVGFLLHPSPKNITSH